MESWLRASRGGLGILNQSFRGPRPRSYCRWLCHGNNWLEMDYLDSYDFLRMYLASTGPGSRNLRSLYPLQKSQTSSESGTQCASSEIQPFPEGACYGSETATSYVPSSG